ncbi:unnamed protein product, partial [Fusarium fujikuroi]
SVVLFGDFHQPCLDLSDRNPARRHFTRLQNLGLTVDCFVLLLSENFLTFIHGKPYQYPSEIDQSKTAKITHQSFLLQAESPKLCPKGKDVNLITKVLVASNNRRTWMINCSLAALARSWAMIRQVAKFCCHLELDEQIFTSLCFCRFSRQEPVDHSQLRTLQELSLIAPALVPGEGPPPNALDIRDGWNNFIDKPQRLLIPNLVQPLRPLHNTASDLGNAHRCQMLIRNGSLTNCHQRMSSHDWDCDTLPYFKGSQGFATAFIT